MALRSGFWTYGKDEILDFSGKKVVYLERQKEHSALWAQKNHQRQLVVFYGNFKKTLDFLGLVNYILIEAQKVR